MSQLFARKPIEDLQPPGGDEPSLERVLGAGDLIMLAIGAVILSSNPNADTGDTPSSGASGTGMIHANFSGAPA